MLKTQTPRFLQIGDPYYAEENGFSKEKLEKLVFSKQIPEGFHSSITVEEKDGYSEVMICIAPSEKILGIYQREKYLQMSECTTFDLGCDTACFQISDETDGIIINTLSDGYFGNTLSFSVNGKDFGHIIYLWVDNSALNAEEFLEKIKYIFKEEKSK